MDHGYALAQGHGAIAAQQAYAKNLAYDQANTAQAPRDLTEAEVLGNRIAGVLQRFESTLMRLDQFGGRLCGHGTESGKTAGNPQPPRAVPNGHIATFSAALDELDSRLSMLDMITARLERTA